MSFEQSLVRIVELVFASAKPLPPTFVWPTLPASHHYADSYDSYDELCRHVLDAKNVFELLVAGAVYIITGTASRGCLMSNSATPTPSWPTWALNAIKSSSDDGFGEWMHHLLFSQAFDFSKPRVGAFIDLRSCQFLHQIDFFLQSGIPIAFICSLDSSADGILATLRISDDTKRAIIPSPEERARFASNSASGWGRGVASSSEWSAVVGAAASLSEWDAAAAAASSSGWAAAGASMTGWGATDASSGEWGATSMGSGWGSVVKTVDWQEIFKKQENMSFEG